MLELKFMRENVEMLKEMLKNRNSNVDMDTFVELDSKRREVLSEVENLKRVSRSSPLRAGPSPYAGDAPFGGDGHVRSPSRRGERDRSVPARGLERD